MNTAKEYLETIFQNDMTKIILSKPFDKQVRYQKMILTRKSNGFQSTCHTEKQVFHENLEEKDLLEYCLKHVPKEFLQLNAWDQNQEHILLCSKKGTVTYKVKKTQATPVALNTEHNRAKEYLIPEGTIVAPLVDMGIFTADGKIVRTMYDKYKQINRFLEIVDDGMKQMSKKKINIIDFGCGKSYLTFVLYYYFTEIKKLDVTIIGLDLKKDVIEKCNEAAKRYEYKNLRFELGDINGYQPVSEIDVVISLHACDTATDYALYNAIQWKAKLIYSVPCCQHEANSQMASDNLSLFTHYGIVKERMAALMTDSIRGNLLEYAGYKTQLLEFVDMEHTPKNILIRAVRRDITPQAVQKRALNEVKQVISEFNLDLTLYRLLFPK